jgi:hypothetical protein
VWEKKGLFDPLMIPLATSLIVFYRVVWLQDTPNQQVQQEKRGKTGKEHKV